MQENEGEAPGALLKGLFWRRPDDIVLHMQRQQAKAQRSSRPQQREQEQQQLHQQHPDKAAILFSSSRPASTVAQGLLPSHAFAGAISGLAVSNPGVIRYALLHPGQWRYTSSTLNTIPPP